MLLPPIEANRPLHSDDRSKFKVVIIYQDRTSGRRAKHFYDGLVHKLDQECGLSLEIWNFQVLAIPQFRESATQSAARADLVQ
jgi:hypothetical protein